MHSDDERAHFAADPDATLSHHGLAGLSPADVHDAVLLVQDSLTVDWSQAYGAGAAHTPPMETVDTSGWWTSDDPERVTAHEVSFEHPAAPDVVDEVLYDAPDLHFGS
jgi:hypothetical protein